MTSRSVLTAAILLAFTMSLFLSLWAFSSCGALGMVGFGSPPRGMCTFFMGPEHVRIWRAVFTAVLTLSLSAGAMFILTLLQRKTIDVSAHLSRPRPPGRTREEQSDDRFREPLREAFASGIVQHGSRGR